MYNLTNNQKNLAKWLVKNVRDGSLDEEFSLHVIKPMDSLFPKFMFEDYRGTVEELDMVDITKGSLCALIDEKLINYDRIQLPTQEIWLCILTGNIYNAVDNNFKNPDTAKSQKYRQNPWISGSFYLIALVVVSAAFAVMSAYIPLYIIPILLIAAIIALGVIGAFQLRMDGELNESNFLTLMIATYKRLPLLIQDKTKPPREK